jgi:hypothetical protein
MGIFANPVRDAFAIETSCPWLADPVRTGRRGRPASPVRGPPPHI